VERTVRAILIDTFDDVPEWHIVTEQAFLAAVAGDRELFIAAEDFGTALDFAAANGLTLYGMEAARVPHRVEMAEDLDVVTFDDAPLQRARVVAEDWATQSGIVIAASFDPDGGAQ
jgi:hypothetical protein